MARVAAVASLIRPHLNKHGLTHDLVEAQCAAPLLFAAPPFKLNASRTRCSIDPADHQLVAGYIELAVRGGLEKAALSGTLLQVERT
jgi:hypothetical protein